MSGYTKLFSSIIHSTIWREPNEVRIVWVTMLAMCDRDGVVEASLPGLADAARVDLQQCEDALKRLSSPDKYSRTTEHDGRRVGKRVGGWEILNYHSYRDRASKEETRAKAAERQRRKRERDRNSLSPAVTNVTKNNDKAEADPPAPAKADQKKIKTQKPPASTPLETMTLAKKYLDVFNAVFDTNCRAQSIIEKKIEVRLKDSTAPWQILCAPILQMAMDPGTKSVRNFNPEMLLRTGANKRTSENGATHGATDWIERIYLSADQQQLDERLTTIAAHFGLVADIQKTGCRLASTDER